MFFRKLFPLFIFSLSFAFIEAAVVVYLRKLLGFELNFPNIKFIAFVSPCSWLFKDPQLNYIETFRETATLLVLAAFGWTAGNGFRRRLGAFLASFALWDIFYYVFLKLLLNWPTSVWTTDVFSSSPFPPSDRCYMHYLSPPYFSSLA
jgi:hypothetical protein